MRANGGCDARSNDLAGIVWAVPLEPHAVVTIACNYMELPVCDEIVALTGGAIDRFLADEGLHDVTSIARSLPQ